MSNESVKRDQQDAVLGISVRDYFAAKAMAALAGNETFVAFVRGFLRGRQDIEQTDVQVIGREALAAEAYALADAMLTERSK